MIDAATIRAIAEALIREQEWRVFLAELRERQRYIRKIRKEHKQLEVSACD